MSQCDQTRRFLEVLGKKNLSKVAQMFVYFFGATLEKIGNFFNLLSGHTDNNNQLCHRSEPKGQPREHN